jgi:clathrin heavy chain
MLNTHAIPHEFLVAFFGHMTPNNALQCLYDLMKHNQRANLQIVVQTAIKYSEQLTTSALIQMLEQFACFEGLFYFLGSVLNTSEDPDVHFKYIEAASKLNHDKEVERVVRETKVYDPVKVKDFLKEQRSPNPRALIYLCDIHGFGEELTRYLYKNSNKKYLELYLTHLNNAAAPVVLGTLLDLDCDENYVKQILNTLRASCPVEALVEEMEKRNRLRVIQGWLEDRAREGSQNVALHTGLAKIYVDINKDPQTFLINNRFYDSKLVGKYCEDRDPHLAVTAYQRAWGECDDELIEVTNKNALYRVQARYLVERKELDLWKKVLDPTNPNRRQVIDQIIAFALPESRDSEEVGVTVKAFMAAKMENELLELLEKIVLHNSEFSNSRNLQNLLILTAIKCDRTRVIDYINRLDNFDAPELAKIAIEKYDLYEEAFMIYRKVGMNEEAIEVLLSNITNLDRAKEFAEKIASPQVWSRLGGALLDAGQVDSAIESYIKAQDTTNYARLIAATNQSGSWAKLIPFLLLARKQMVHQRDSSIDSELIFAYAKTDKLTELEEFISSSNQADISSVGDRCYDHKLFEAGRILFASINNWPKLASCLVKLKRFTEALEAAKKANTPKTWKEVNFACVAAREFKLAVMAGINIIIHPDHLEELIQHYEKYGYYNELVSLLESGITHERAHPGIFTELGILYAKYRPEKLMDHCRNYFQKLNIPKLLRACERYKMWSETVFLYIKYDEFDNALMTMVEHSPVAWTHELFTQVIQKISNPELVYRSMIFYLEEQPLLLNELLRTVSAKVDLAKTVLVMRRTGHLPLILPWLLSVQMHNAPAINEAINEILYENEDCDALRTSITEFDSFDQIALAQKTERHELLEMRRIAAYLYRVNQRYAQSLALSKQDEIYKDCMETCAESKNPDLARELLEFFVSIKDKEAFCAASYACYELLSPDVVMELAWRSGYMDFAMPFFIQSTRDMYSRLNALEKKTQQKEKKEEEKAEEQANAPLDVDAMHMMMPGLNSSMPALMAPPGMMTGMNPMMTGMNPMMTGMNPMMAGMNPMMTGMNPAMMTGMNPSMMTGQQFFNR